MKINNKLVKHYIQYDISMLTEQEREELAREVNNEYVKYPHCVGIKMKSEVVGGGWRACFTNNLNHISIKTILEDEKE